MADRVKIEFVRDTEKHEINPPIQAGAVIEVDAASVERWLRRGAAVLKQKDSPKREPEQQPKRGPGRPPKRNLMKR